MASYNKAKLYASIENADVTRDYTHEEILALKENKKEISFVEPAKEETNILGEFVENEGKLLLDSDLPKKRGRQKKTEVIDS